jgi:hypothetical protein
MAGWTAPIPSQPVRHHIIVYVGVCSFGLRCKVAVIRYGCCVSLTSSTRSRYCTQKVLELDIELDMLESIGVHLEDR